MFLIKYKRFDFLGSTNSRLFSLSSAVDKWDLASSVCLERKPILTKELNDIESKYSKVLNKVENEMSFKSDHEIRLLKDKLYGEELKKSNSFINVDQVNVQTGQEFEDISENEHKAFKFADRITEDDVINNVGSTNRRLSNSLLLLIKQNLGKSSNWVLPLGLRQEGETMRQAAERVLLETCGTNMQTKFLGNAPVGFYKYRYPKSAICQQSIGMKIFFFKAQLLSGNVSKEVCSNFQWLSQQELASNILQEDYLRNVKMFLLDDEGLDNQNTTSRSTD